MTHPFNLRSSGPMVAGVAATFIGTVVGAGFASGQEIYQFFSRQGRNGSLGLLLAILILGAAGAKVFQIGRILQPESYGDLLRLIMGRRLAVVADLLLGLFYIVLIGVMFAGSGAIFAELGLGYWMGIVGTAALLLAVLFNELPGLIAANLVIIPLMFVGAVLASLVALKTRCAVLAPGPADWNWVLASVQFSSYNLVLSVPVLLSLSKRYPFAPVLTAGGWLGSLGLGAMAALIHYSIMLHLPHLRTSPLPMIELAKSAGTWFYIAYALILWAEMLTTLLADTYGLAERLASGTGWPYRFWILVLTAAGIIVAKAGFVNLITRFYPFYGYLCLVILALIIGVRLPKGREPGQRASLLWQFPSKSG